MKKEKKFLIPEIEIIDFTYDDIITGSEADFQTIDDSQVPIIGGGN